MRVSAVTYCALIAAIALLSGCSAQGGAASPGGPISDSAGVGVLSRDAASDVTVGPNGTEVVGVSQNGIAKFTDPVYGEIWAYIKGTKAHVTHVIMLTSDQPVVFKNIDPEKGHTVAFLGDASKTSAPWPTSFDGGTKQSKAGTAVGTTGWNTGRLDQNSSSLVYNTGAPGFYMIGCEYHYKYGMRNVLIVQ
jgi:plastocyanin